MKKILALCIGLFTGLAAFAQSAEEIMEKMDAVMDGQPMDRVAMTMEVKIPILGTMKTRAYTFGEKERIDAVVKGITIITWSDGKTEWTYDSKDNKVEITNVKADKKEDSASDDMEMFSNVAEGYDVSIKSQDADSWTIQCKKNKANKSKDDPKNMEIVVQKGTFYPLSLSAKVSGTSIRISEIAFDVTEEKVTFNPAAYPTAKIVDKR